MPPCNLYLLLMWECRWVLFSNIYKDWRKKLEKKITNTFNKEMHYVFFQNITLP